MTIADALQQATLKLKQNNILSAHLDAEVLLMHVLKKDKAFLYAHGEKKLTATQNKKLQLFIRQRVRQTPIAYIIGHKEFYGFDFQVTPAVLIPRPDTELLIEKVLELFPNKKQTFTLADIGTGSGCIAITLKRLFPKATVFGTDVSVAALKVARTNSKKLSVTVNWLKGNLLQPIANKKIDLLVANLPYVPLTDFKKLPKQHPLRHEPKQALWSGDDGLDLYTKLFDQLSALNHQPLFVLFEFDPRQYRTIQKLVKQKLPGHRRQGFIDLAGMWRVILLENQ